MPARLIATYCLNVADLIFTLRLVKIYGLDVEINPIGRWILADPQRIVFFKLALVAGALVVIWIFRERRTARIASYIVLIAYIFLTIYHFILLKRG